MPLLPYKADDGPRMISIRLTSVMSSGKSCPNQVVWLKMLSAMLCPFTMTRKCVPKSPGSEKPRTPTKVIVSGR